MNSSGQRAPNESHAVTPSINPVPIPYYRIHASSTVHETNHHQSEVGAKERGLKRLRRCRQVCLTSVITALGTQRDSLDVVGGHVFRQFPN